VPPYQRFQGRQIAQVDEAIEQLTVGQARLIAAQEGPAKLGDRVWKISGGHVVLARLNSFSILLLPGRWRFDPFFFWIV
jgi:hypothetical protein